MTLPYNPPAREPKATPKKREKKHEPGQASARPPPAVEKSADEMLDEELRKTNAQSSTDRPNEADLEQPFLHAHAATGAELPQQSGMAESTETFDATDPLKPLLAYVLFVLHYRNNPFADSWPISSTPKCEKFAIGNELFWLSADHGRQSHTVRLRMSALSFYLFSKKLRHPSL